MDSLSSIKDKLLNIKITKSWQYLIYLYLVLPAFLFFLSFLTRSSSLGKVFGSLFHNYGLFAINPIPNFSAFTGIIGAIITVWFLVSALCRRDLTDFAVSAVLAALNLAYFLFGYNYILLSVLGIYS